MCTSLKPKRVYIPSASTPNTMAKNALPLIAKARTCVLQSMNHLTGPVLGGVVVFPAMPNGLLLTPRHFQETYMGYFNDGDTIVTFGTSKGEEIRETHEWLDHFMRCQMYTYFVGLSLQTIMVREPLEIRFQGGVTGSISRVAHVRCQVDTIPAGIIKHNMLFRTKSDELNHYLLELTLQMSSGGEKTMLVELTPRQLSPPLPKEIDYFPGNRVPDRYKNLQTPIPLSSEGDSYTMLMGDGGLDYITHQLTAARFL